ncbi:MAG: B12-binding domain-containing radical SAM protein [Phycisphaerae bacterium]|nr:B12-binding domain-containing radical SAM protein [Phycisphaerae bacterium]
MKIALMCPSSGPWNGIGKNKLFNGRSFRFSMLSLLTVARLSPADSQITLVDEQVDSIDFDGDYDVVGLTVMTATAPRAFEIAARFRSRGIPVVMGGFYPSLNPHQALEHCDAVVVGPAMDAWPRLLEDLTAGKIQPIYHGNPNGQIPCDLPRHLLSRHKYATTSATYATMGCRNRCRFCSVSRFYDAHHYCRPVEDVIGEVGTFDEKFFIFVDDNLTQDRDYALALFRGLAGLRKHWLTQLSIEVAWDDELLAAMAHAGCVGVFVGLESFNDKALGTQDKAFNVPQRYRDAIARFHTHGIFVEGGLMFGFDDDDAGVFARTLKLLGTIGIDTILVSIVTPLPGTALHEQMRDRIRDTDLAHYDYSHVVFTPKRMTADQLQAGADWVAYQYYRPRAILRRLLRWMVTPQGLSHLIYPLILNLAFYGRNWRFGLRGYDPAVRPAIPNSATLSPTCA